MHKLYQFSLFLVSGLAATAGAHSAIQTSLTDPSDLTTLMGELFVELLVVLM